MFNFFGRKKEDDSLTVLVQRLVLREDPKHAQGGLLRYFKCDAMGASEFNGDRILAATIAACKDSRREDWDITGMRVVSDAFLFYVGPQNRLNLARRFAEIQLNADDSFRREAEHPLKEPTLMRESFYWGNNPGPQYCGWWRIDSGHQFFLFKSEALAEVCLKTLRYTNLRDLG